MHCHLGQVWQVAEQEVGRVPAGVLFWFKCFVSRRPTPLLEELATVIHTSHMQN